MRFRKLLLLTSMLIGMSLLILVGCTGGSDGEQVRTQLVTVPPIIITATPDPNVTPNVIIITATFDRTQVAVPDDLVPDNEDSDSAVALNVTQIGDVTSAEGETDTSEIPQGCLSHTVESGDAVFSIADFYGVDPFLMLAVNGFTEDTAFIDVGDILIVPVDGCPVDTLIEQVTEDVEPEETEEIEEPEVTEEVTAEVTEEPTLEITFTPSPSPTVTLAPTAVDSELEIVDVTRAGDVTAEGVVIRNNGRRVDLEDWTLSDADGNEYVFGPLLIFSQGEVTIYTRSGQSLPVAVYWGLEEAVWQAGDVVTLTDTNGVVQAAFRVPSDTDLP